jgi:uncharacterized protein
MPDAFETLPWYREPWPWLLMSGPAAVLVAGAVTTWIAFATADGLVAEDYYKQGLAINKVLKREEAARRLGLSAEVVLQAGKIRVELKGEEPPVLFVHLAHATRAGHDLRLRLARSPSGAYEADLPPLPQGHWRIVLEDPGGSWRLVSEGREKS